MPLQPHHWLLVFALFLTGVAHLALLPPFEGYDETMHYSSIQQIATTGKIPFYGEAKISQTVVAYRDIGPMPYSTNRPFENNGGMIYEAFFRNPELVSGYKQNLAVLPQSFTPGAELNWQAQHPPLYYILMAAVIKPLATLPLTAQFFWLRLVSWIIALTGLVIGLRAAAKTIPQEPGNKLMLLGLLYPFCVPGFFSEFARLGNDSLCALLFGTLWVLLVSRQDRPYSMQRLFAIGTVLGAGLLTKAFFLPITAAIGIWLLLLRKDPLKSRIKASIISMGVAGLIGGIWHLHNIISHGSLSGGSDFIELDNHGGFWAGLATHFSFLEVIRGMAIIPASWLWASPWSLARWPDIFYLVLAVAGFMPLAAYTFQLRRKPLSDIAWLPVWPALLFLAGLGYHVFVNMALTGKGSTGGWYLHIMAPAIAYVFAVGLGNILRGPKPWKALFLGGTVFTAAYHLSTLWAQTAMFGGCATKAADKTYAFDDGAFCLTDIAAVYHNASIIIAPGLAATCLVIALLSLALVWIAQGRLAQR
ncbi:MAG: hypothetical protein GC131_01995 [Alphaproteobacteria bacterium]|nr:hypothetical protein [Alphaproteobacteria bacterium]